jgi:phenylacetic acid degradation operon negative regulatory protein
MPRNPDLKRIISRVTWGVTKTVAGLILYQVALGAAVATTGGGKSSRTATEAIKNADEISDALFVALNPDQWQSAWQNLRRRGFINSVRGKQYEGAITKLGLEKLQREIKIYQEDRPWDKRIYLITYDIEEEDKDLRNDLRKYLKEIGCVPLQKSTYLTVYNPRGLLRKWAGRRIRIGDILVSDLGPDGSFGDRPLQELIADAYQLSRLNLQYGGFLNEFPAGSKRDSVKKQQAFFSFNSILAQDPQLPFELLPDWWLGDKAFRLYRRIVGDASKLISVSRRPDPERRVEGERSRPSLEPEI